MKSTSSRQNGSTRKSSPPMFGKSPGGAADPKADISTARQEPVTSAAPQPQPVPTREEKIAIVAYYKAERRGFANSGELDDWLEAEKEVDRQNSARSPGGSHSGT